MTRTTETGRAASDLVRAGLEVNAEIAREEPTMVKGLDEALLRLVDKHGLRMVLLTIQDAACCAAEVREEDCFIAADTTDVSALRARVFVLRLGRAIEALK